MLNYETLRQQGMKQLNLQRWKVYSLIFAHSLASSVAMAQASPSKPVKLLVGLASCGAADSTRGPKVESIGVVEAG